MTTVTLSDRALEQIRAYRAEIRARGEARDLLFGIMWSEGGWVWTGDQPAFPADGRIEEWLKQVPPAQILQPSFSLVGANRDPNDPSQLIVTVGGDEFCVGLPVEFAQRTAVHIDFADGEFLIAD